VNRTPAATVTRLGPSFDVLAAYGPPAGHLFVRRGIGVAGGAPAFGVVASDPRAVVEALRAIDTGDASAIALGALPFDPTAPGTLDVASSAVVRLDDDVTWRVDLGADTRDARSERSAGAAPHDAFAPPQLRLLPSAEDYAEAVRRATDAIAAGDLRKVVLARTIEVDAGRELDPRRLASRLRAVDPDAFVFAAPTENGVIVGASPELLVSRHGRVVRSNPLAGSAPRAGDPDEDRALARGLGSSAKDREEHAIVVDAVAETLGPFCEDLRWDPEPVLLETANVWHLSTRFHGMLRDPAPSSLELVRALHPTPAVAGTPTPAALASIAELEPFDRARYAGPVGWIDANGDGDWALALRCAELRGDRAIAYAGAGVVASSDPAAEVAETDRKFRAFLDALRWG
jgi:isochorismate synthase